MAGASKANQRQNKRHAAGYTKYRGEFRGEKNKLRRLAKHLKRFPDDRVAVSAVDRVKGTIKGYA